MDDWLAHFNDATEAYSKSLHSRASLSNAERVESVKIFRDWIANFKSGGEPARAILETELHNEDFHRASAAARLLIECGDPVSLASLSQNVINLRGVNFRFESSW